MTTVIEKPMLFRAPMVRAILDGRKTQTRRIMKPQPHESVTDCYPEETEDFSGFTGLWCLSGRTEKGELWLESGSTITCPHPVGSRIWVKETWMLNHIDRFSGIPKERPLDTFGPAEILYRADGEFDEQIPDCCDGQPKWDPSIYMPRWAARIILDVTEVRVQRLRDISDEDAYAEGAKQGYDAPLTRQQQYVGSVEYFSRLWTSINGPNSWDANPWVWAYTFKVVQP